MALATGSLSFLIHCGALGRRLAGRCGQRLQDGDGIGNERQRGAVVAPDLARIVVDVDQRLARHRRGRQGVALGRHLGQARADGEDEVGFEIALGGGLGDLEAQVPGIVGVRVGEVVLALEGERDRAGGAPPTPPAAPRARAPCRRQGRRRSAAAAPPWRCARRSRRSPLPRPSRPAAPPAARSRRRSVVSSSMSSGSTTTTGPGVGACASTKARATISGTRAGSWIRCTALAMSAKVLA